jgi:integrase
MKLGVHGTITTERARDIAARELGKIASGEDPAEAKRLAKAAEAKRLAIPTMAQLCDRYLAEYAEIHKRPISIRDDAAMLAKIIRPALGAKRVPDVEQDDIAALHRGMKETPYRANRVLALLSKMFSLASVSWKLRSDNPVKGVKRYSEERRYRYLSGVELARLGEALAVHPNRITSNAIRLLLLTGARRGEVLSMTWSQVDQEPGIWVKPSAHTKQKREHRIPLSPGARAVIDDMRRHRKADDEFVFPGRAKGEKPVVELKKTWAALTKTAAITGARVHDLRHTFASLLVTGGASLPLIGSLLGHTSIATTERYAHLAIDPLREAADRVDAQIAALASKQGAEILRMPAPGKA